jgi:GNAT superfamily N-acetyltransferase
VLSSPAVNDQNETPALTWRNAVPLELAAISRIADRAHADLFERPEVFAEKMQLFPDGCFVLVSGAAIVGYAVSHPWKIGSIPPLDAFLGRIPIGCDCLFIHDVVVQPEARGRRAGAALIETAAAVAGNRALASLALVSVYDTYPIWERLGFACVADPALVDKLASYGATARYMVRKLG